MDNNDESLEQIAKRMEMSEQELVCQLESASTTERSALIVHIRQIATGGMAGASEVVWDKTHWEIEQLRTDLLERQDIGAVQRSLQEMGISAERAMLQSVKNYNFNSRGLEFRPENYSAWTRLANGKGIVDDVRYLVHEIAEVDALQRIQQRTGFDFIVRDWDTMTAVQRKRWRADFRRYYMQAHLQAIEQEYDFIAKVIGKITNNRVKISRTVAAAIDPTRDEARRYMIVDGVPLSGHRQFDEWQSRGEEVIEIGRGTLTRLNLSPGGTIKLKELIDGVKRTPLSSLK